ncbi:MAG: oligosaccharide flippase family protein [Solirubrobacteraceae bacterium]
MTASGTTRPDTVAQSTVRVLLAYVGTAGFTAVLTFYLVRVLGPRDFGVFSLALGIGNLMHFGADFGIAASATRFIAEKRGDNAAIAVIFASALRLKLPLAGAVAIVGVLLAQPVANAYGEASLAWPLRAVALSVLFESSIGLFSGTFIAVGRTATNLKMVVSESFVECSGTILLVILTGGAAAAAWGRALGYAFGVALGAFLMARLLGRRALAAHRRGTDMAKLGRYAGTLMIVNGAYSLFSSIDVLLIGAILSTTAVGAFSAPLRIAVLLQYPGLALANSIAPRVARSETGEPDYAAVQFGLRVMTVVGFAMIAPLLAWAQPITDVILGADYQDSVAVLRGMAPFVFLQGLGIMLSLSVNYVGQARRRVPVAIAALAVNAVIDLLLLDSLGVVAAALGTSAGYAVYTAGHFRICQPIMGLALRPLALTFARSAAAGGAMAAVLVAFGTADLGVVEWIAGLVLSGAAFGAVIVATRELTVAELRTMARR